MAGLQPTQFTIFHLFALITIVGCFAAGSSIGKEYYGTLGIFVGGLIGIFVGIVVGSIPDRLATRHFFRKIERSSNEELWKIVNFGIWNFNNTLALLQLAARNQDVSEVLPRIIRLLESDSELHRIYGWDALRLVFDRETKIIEEYDPRSSKDDCLSKVKKLKEIIRQNPSVIPNATLESK